MWMMKLTTSIAKSPKWRKTEVTTVACSCCLRALRIPDAYVDRDGYIWCPGCKDSK